MTPEPSTANGGSMPPSEPPNAVLSAAWGSALGLRAAVVLPCERVFDFSVSQSQDNALPDSRDVGQPKSDAKAWAACAGVDLREPSAPTVDGKPSIMPAPTARERRQCRWSGGGVRRTDERPRRSEYGEPKNPAVHWSQYRDAVLGRRALFP
jgi:hypothetical protein